MISLIQRSALSTKDGDKYLHMSAQERLGIFKELALKEKLAALKEDLADFNVHFDVWFSERTLHPDCDKCRMPKTHGQRQHV